MTGGRYRSLPTNNQVGTTPQQSGTIPPIYAPNPRAVVNYRTDCGETAGAFTQRILASSQPDNIIINDLARLTTSCGTPKIASCRSAIKLLVFLNVIVQRPRRERIGAISNDIHPALTAALPAPEQSFVMERLKEERGC